MTSKTKRPTIPEAYLRDVDGRILAHRGALEELTGLSKKSVDRLAGQPGFPEPVIARGPERRSWYDPEALIDVAVAYEPPKVGVDPEAAAAGPADKLLTPREAAELMQIAYPGTFNKYVQISEPSWRRGEAGILPVPDEERPRGTKQIARRWKKSTIIAHQKRRPGHGGRPSIDA
jgi:predicted DNA-binding transcriptional regulator AlpA